MAGPTDGRGPGIPARSPRAPESRGPRRPGRGAGRCRPDGDAVGRCHAGRRDPTSAGGFLPAVASRLPDVKLSSCTASRSPTRWRASEISRSTVLFLWAPERGAPSPAPTRRSTRRPLVALPAGHPLARLSRVPLERLREFPCVAPSRRAPPALHDLIGTIQPLAGSGGTRPAVDADTVSSGP